MSKAIIVGLIGLLFGAVEICGDQFSARWGEHGEKWNPESRLPDFSFAGYPNGEKPLPNIPPRR